MKRNDLIIGGKAGGYSGDVSAMQSMGRREAQRMVREGVTTRGVFNAAAKKGFLSAARRRRGEEVGTGNSRVAREYFRGR